MDPASLEDLLRLAEAGDAERLREAVREQPQAGERLAAVLAERGDAAALAALAGAGLPKPLRKAVGRALHRLRTRGIAAPEAGRVGRLEAPAAAGAGASAPEAWLGFDPPSVFLLLVVRSPEQWMFSAILDNQERILGGSAIPEATRRMVRAGVDAFTRDGGAAVPLPPGHAAARLRAALSRAPSPHGKDAREKQSDLRAKIAAADAIAGAEHPALALAPADPAEVDARARRFASRLSREAMPFVIDPPCVTRLADQLNEAERSPIALPPAAHAEREDGIVRRFLEQDLPADLVAALGLRFLDRAWIRRAREPAEATTDAATGALLLRRPSSPAAQHFLRAYVMEHLQGPEAEDGRGRRVAPDLPERRSGGGIILP